MRTGFLLLVLLQMVLPVYAGVYKWTDSNGQVHYGDKPAAAGEAEEIDVDTDTSSGFSLDDEDRDEKRQRLLDAMQEDRLEKEAQREKERAEKDERRRRCAYLKDRLRRAQSATAMYTLDKDGNRVFYSDKKRKQSESKLRDQMRKVCN